MGEGQPVAIEAAASGWAGNATVDRVRYPETEFSIKIHPATTLRCIVVNRQGQTVVGARVELSPVNSANGEKPLNGYTDHEGVWLCGYVSLGHWKIAIASSHGSAQQLIQVKEGANEALITLEPGNTVSGRVVDDLGTPVAKLTISAVDDALEYQTLISTDEEGRFKVNVPSGVGPIRLRPFALPRNLAPKDIYTIRAFS